MKQYVSKFSGKELEERLTRVDNIPTKTSELNNDSGFISEIEANNKYTDKNKTDVLEGDIKTLKEKITNIENNPVRIEIVDDLESDDSTKALSAKQGKEIKLLLDQKADTENGKIIVSQLPDFLLGQVMFGGIIEYSPADGQWKIFPTQSFKTKYPDWDINEEFLEGLYPANYEGIYFIAENNEKFNSIDINVGDWIISTGVTWTKVDNTDAVSSVAGLVGNVNASSLAAALTGITDSNALARKIDLPTKLSDLKVDIEIGGGDTEYESAISDKTLTTPNAVGGIAKGTKVSDLEGKTFSEMFDDLLFPTVNPEFTAPTASIAFKSYSSTQEVGATGPTSANFTTGYNAGEIKLNGVKQANRGGALNSTNSFIYVNGSTSNKTLPTKVTLGSTTFKYRAAYNEGPQPKNNKGGNYGSPLAAGTVDSSAITLNGTYPWYASTSSATSANPVVKQSLVAWNVTAGKMSTGQFTVQPSGTLPQVFKLPRKIDVLQLKNALNGNMENVEEINGVPKDYTESTETINIGGTNVTYYVYTYSGSTRGSVTLLAKF